MEPIGKTYSDASASAIYDAYRNSLQGPRSVKRDEVKEISAPSSSQITNEQQGIRLTDTKEQEFRPYAADGRITGNGKQPPIPGKTADQKTTADPVAIAAKELEDPRIQQEVARLKNIEEKVKAHEAAHKSAGGAATGPVSYSYTRGPDGRNYVTGGEVPITISTGNTPQETISRMQQVIRAALAPADPSPQDRAVAAQASTIQQQARQELSSQQLAKTSEEYNAPAAIENNQPAEEYKTEPAVSSKPQFATVSAFTDNTVRDRENGFSFYA